jgi:heme exporter protein A
LLEGRALTCVRDGRTLFENLDCRLKRGEVLRLEGANGAGKTSLLRILCGLALPRNGAVRWNGEDIHRCRGEYHEQLLYIGHCPGIKEELTPLENLRFFRSLGGHAGERELQEAALHAIGLYGYEEVPVRVLSAGQRRRVALARLWLSTASLWILDEPFTAIDREGIRHLEERLADHVRRGGMLVITSHQSSLLEGCHVRRLGL